MRITKIAYGFIIFSLLLAILILGKNLLIPLVIAFVLWYLYNAITHSFDRIKIKGKMLPLWLRYVFATILIGTAIYLFSKLITNNVNNIIEQIPHYQTRLETLLNQLFVKLNIKEPPSFSMLSENMDLKKNGYRCCSTSNFSGK